MKQLVLEIGRHYGKAYEGRSAVDTLKEAVVLCASTGCDELLIKPYGMSSKAGELRDELACLALEGFEGLVLVQVLGVKSEEEGLFACLGLREELEDSEVRILTVLGSKECGRLDEILALSGFEDLPEPERVEMPINERSRG